MSPDTLLQHFDAVADAPNGVQKLRELILQLAVRGKLVPQESSDEPASVLLERIEAEKQRLYKKGKIGKPKPLPSVQCVEAPFEVPEGWEWTSLDGAFAYITDGDHQPPPRAASGIPFLVIGDVSGGRIDFDHPRFVPESYYDKLDNARKPARGDVLYTVTGSFGIPLVVDSDHPFCVQRHIAILKSASSANVQFLYWLLRSRFVFEQATERATGIAQKTVSLGVLRTLVIPLPPLAEQRRIVEKVDQLMALCDELEERQQRRAAARMRVNRASLHHLTAAIDGTEVAEHWQRIRDNFRLLYDAPEAVTELRQAILQLAVRGKLVPQESSDEPASELLERIKAHKEQLGSKSKPLPPLHSDAMPFEAPDGWQWVRFGEATINRDGERIPVSSEIRAGRQGQFPYYGASGVIDCIDDFLFDKTLLLIGEDGANLLLRSTPIAFVAEGKYWVNNHAHVIDGISLDLLRYVAIFINATDLAPYVTGTAQPKLNQAKLNSIPLALPPFAEQSRIVEKVDQLMALCDELEANLTRSRTKAEKLASAVGHHLIAA